MLLPLDRVISFPGYCITDQIYLGSRTIVYRGIREQDQQPVIIKLMRNEYPSLNELAQFRNQYIITKKLNFPGIVKTYTLENYHNGYAIVMEDFGGISLQQWISKNSIEISTVDNINNFELPLTDFLDISIQIASILDQLHRQRVIHKDIKPANILIQPTTKEIKIIDFSIASLLPREIQCLTNPNVLEGTLSYISPEQTGRMNRGIDYRTDFYSLGVTFFELLTGQLPFIAADSMELVYSHIAKEAPKPSEVNSKIPPILSEIISKLMAKNAEDRYQSCLGLKYDLEICKQQWQETSKIDSFELATRDISNRFLIPEKLYGRQREVETLLAAFERLATFPSACLAEMILVVGDPGVGKTAVVNEVHKPIVYQRSYFIKGKFDQFQRDIPFSGWVEAFQDLIRQLLLESDAEIQRWKTKILSALGNQAQLPIISNQLSKYKFVHDRVQQAAYSLIPEDQKKSIHLKIGKLLFKKIPTQHREENIFTLVNQFNIGLDLIANQIESDELAAMNLIAGRRALASTAYVTAIKYLITGIKLLKDDVWKRKYELILSLYETAAEAAYLAGDFEQMEKFVQIVLAQAKTLLEKVKVYEVKIKAYGAQNQALEAVNTALYVLKLLGMEFPENPTQSDVQLAIAEISSNLASRHIEDLINLPQMTQAQSLAIVRILSSAIPVAYQVVPNLFPLILVKQINLSLQHGNAPLSAYAYVTYGLMLCGVVEDIESGYQFGKLALSLVSKSNAKEVKAKIFGTFYGTISHWQEHAKEILKPLLETYPVGLETGDLEFAAYCLKFHCSYSYFIGRELTELEREMVIYSNTISQIKQETVFNWNAIYRQSVLNLLGYVKNPCRLIGEAYDEEKMLPLHLEVKDGVGLLYLYFSSLHLCYLFQEFWQAVENANLAEKYLEGGTGQLVVPLFYFYDSLARVAIYPNEIGYEQKLILKRIQANQEKIQHWANHAPMNYLHKFYLVEAEQHRVLGEYLEAIDCYDRAIALAKEHEYINEEALANELAAKFYLEWGKQKIAQTYLTDAYYCYMRWGAKAKVDDLIKRYPQLLAPILQQDKLSPYISEKSTFSHQTTLSTQSSHQTLISSGSSVSDSLDLTSVIKASQALSGEIELEQLLTTLMKVVMENAGASKCALMLNPGDDLDLTVTAMSSNSSLASTYTEFPAISLSCSYDLPVNLINYVKRTKERFVVDDANFEDFLANDRYILRERPKSLLCIPIINQGKFIGILYLENNLTTAAFTRDRLELLQVITTQAAISLENAILYKGLAQAKKDLEEHNHTLEKKVERRTQELNENNHRLKQAIVDLKNAQTQLIQNEKMSSLGQMVAGIAHEINNPINFIHGNITHAQEYVQDLLELITIYQQEYRNPSAQVADKSEEIDLDFLVQDLPKVLDSMKVGTSRIRNIVLGLRNFSHLDEADMKPVDIHEGIDNTLMILQHKLKANNDCPDIQVIKEYGELPEVACYAGQLNQVFMNILSNAIDVLNEGNRLWTIGNGEKDSRLPTIIISTELAEKNMFRIRIADNGNGMNAEVQQKIFDPFFTTKPVGSGTGLGLSISYQIVVDKHKGKLICNSTLGKGTEFVIEIPMQQ
ncbi:MAG: AAA family ATPase [Pelatocladus maniniholoensis HA4357-MV3]|jgi:signal transduction histidine kinase/serine/threonine protein kinase|uniref:histidine kinase n=1 Tax=Pelatocladus maniniholoensis HA4357-MV3 TaxID=1117104 RepID=A0A9E3H9E7_9NOST|nr:AAA family ATPase [Pelatocladus maniniholoensis HA4357-MV3]